MGHLTDLFDYNKSKNDIERSAYKKGYLHEQVKRVVTE